MTAKNPKALLKAVTEATHKMRRIEDSGAEAREAWYKIIRLAFSNGVDRDALAKATGLTYERVWQITKEDT